MANAFAKIFSRHISDIGISLEIAPEELLGRGVFDSRRARQARAGKIVPRIFRERDGVRELSVDRLSHADLVELAKLHNRQRAPQSLYGWAHLSAVDAAMDGRTIRPSPILPDNPFHAEIVLPVNDELEISEEQDQHALNLAMSARWLQA